MLAKSYSAAVVGVEAHAIEVEAANAQAELSSIVVVGLPDLAVRESRDRVRTAMVHSGFWFPGGHTTINLAPADIKKEGPSFDLPIALAVLAASDQIKSPRLLEVWSAGELALNGALRPVRGILPFALAARAAGATSVLVPEMNAAEAAVVKGLNVYAIKNLREAVEYLEDRIGIMPTRVEFEAIVDNGEEEYLDFQDVRGQETAKRAVEVAVAGGHNLLMIGPPGSGKSMMAKRIPSIMPPLSLEEALETMKIHSVAGLLPGGKALVRRRPFRSPHHTISDVGLIGGSANPSPGEVSLAHHGVLFLDELPEFKRSVLEVLRQPLEDGRVTISRAAGTMTFPSRFMLVAAMNPSPAGSREGRSSVAETQRYLNRISGPLLDRIDLHIEVPAVKNEILLQRTEGESSAVIQTRVLAARHIQQERFSGLEKLTCNAHMGTKEIKRYCALGESSRRMLQYAMDDMKLSARAHDRILKVARTMADLATRETVGEEDISEAIQYRSLDRQYWG
jgi:magnesium chelatase family protein